MSDRNPDDPPSIPANPNDPSWSLALMRGTSLQGPHVTPDLDTDMVDGSSTTHQVPHPSVPVPQNPSHRPIARLFLPMPQNSSRRTITHPSLPMPQNSSRRPLPSAPRSNNPVVPAPQSPIEADMLPLDTGPTNAASLAPNSPIFPPSPSTPHTAGNPGPSLPGVAQYVGAVVEDVLNAHLPQAFESAADQALEKFVDRHPNPQRTPKGRERARTRAEFDPDDGTEGGDHLERRKKRRTGPKPLDVNSLHDAVRKFLRKEALLPQERAPIPQSIPQAMIEAFQRDGHPLPDRDHILLDWTTTPAKSDWNKMAIGFLAELFIASLAVPSAVKYDPKKINVESVSTMIQAKLKPTWARAYRERIAAETMDDALRTRIQRRPKQDLTRKRRYARREGTYKRRVQIAQLNGDSDPEIWTHISEVLYVLDVDGMSSDESEDEAPRPRRSDRDMKKVRRVAIEWLNPQFSELWRSVETYDNIPFDAILLRRGNAALSRAAVAKRMDITRPPIVGLPRNWYKEDWYRSLQSFQQKKLFPQDDVAIPNLVFDLLQALCRVADNFPGAS